MFFMQYLVILADKDIYFERNGGRSGEKNPDINRFVISLTIFMPALLDKAVQLFQVSYHGSKVCFVL